MSKTMPVFRRLCAREQITLQKEYPRLIPRLLDWGLGAEDALALAYNATLLRRVLQAEPPLNNSAEVLERYSIGEIAALCETYTKVERGELEYGEAVK